MQIRDMIWSEEQIQHIARHGVTPEQFEAICFGESRIEKAASRGKNPVYLVNGQTSDGRYLHCVVIHFPDGNAYPVTAREMTATEKRRHRKWKNK